MYLVTGGAGFIGSNLVEALVKSGERVRVLDNLSTGKKANLQPFLEKIEWIEGDIRDPKICQGAMNGIQIVLHQAALPSVPRSIADPVLTDEVNAAGTLKLLCAARDAGVKRFVYASSSSAYGDSAVLPKVETMAARPLSPYAVSKLTGEYYCQIFSRLYSLSTVSLRYFNIYGPRQDQNSEYAAVVPKMISALIKNKAGTIYGDGSQSRDFTYIEDCVQAVLSAARAPAEGSGEVINISYGANVSINELYQKIADLLAKTIGPVYEKSRAGDVRHSLADIGKARRLLGFNPQYNIDRGLEKTIAWWKTGAHEGVV
jgi:UDP-N-acetylglucosamine/UDP-N-acetyl-alpha-D-glucosaminouronate 4-epimerase